MNTDDTLQPGGQFGRASLRGMVRHIFPHWGLWLAVFGLFVLNLLWAAFSPRLHLGDAFALTCLGVLACTAVVLLYRDIRDAAGDKVFDRLIKGLLAVMFAVLMMKNLQLFNHLAMSLPFPLADRWLVAGDRALGFDWNAYATGIAARPWLRDSLLFAYNTLPNVMIGVILVALIAMGQPARVNELAYLVLVGGIICISIAGLLPAEAAWNTVARPDVKAMLGGMPGGNWLEQLMALRGSGGIDLGAGDLPGLATFPSFHTCLGLIIAWCSRGHWASFVPGSVIGLSIIAATPVFGGHYVTDLLGGAAVMAGLILVWHRRVPGLRVA